MRMHRTSERSQDLLRIIDIDRTFNPKPALVGQSALASFGSKCPKKAAQCYEMCAIIRFGAVGVADDLTGIGRPVMPDERVAVAYFDRELANGAAKHCYPVVRRLALLLNVLFPEN